MTHFSFAEEVYKVEYKMKNARWCERRVVIVSQAWQIDIIHTEAVWNNLVSELRETAIEIAHVKQNLNVTKLLSSFLHVGIKNVHMSHF